MIKSRTRRRTHPRSKSGCLTCKDRHVRCDERRPFCRNCTRLGRVCSWSENIVEEKPLPLLVPGEGILIPLSPATQQAWVASNQPHQYAIEYAPPHQRGLSTATVSVMIQAFTIFSNTPLPSRCLLAIMEEHLPRYNYFGSRFKCVQYAHACFGSLIHYQETKSVQSKEIYLAHSCAAFKLIQEEIKQLSPSNVDALVTASVWLSKSAESWEQMEVFVDGYSKALSYIKRKNLPTAFPELLTDCFNFRDLVSHPDTPNISSQDRSTVHERILAILDTISSTKEIIGCAKWQAVGFAALEKVAHSVEEACSLTEESEIFRKLAWLRSWLFWIELVPTDTDEQLLLNCQVYALALGAMPLFPSRYSDSLVNTCLRRLDATLEMMSGEAVEIFGEILFGGEGRAGLMLVEWVREDSVDDITEGGAQLSISEI